ncbi:MAG TPA: cytochrome c-type biogenesis CcmF C-terminal domain-containing protein [Kofleriaceae bacterium]
MTATPYSPIAVIGSITLLIAYIIGAWGIAAGIAGNARKSRKLVNSSVYSLYGFSALIGLASALMIYAFVTHDFAIKYVAHTSNVAMSTAYKVTAFWGGLDGSLLFWVLVLGLFSTVAIVVNAKRHRDMIGFVVATILVVQVFFLTLLIFTKNPFATSLTAPPADGEGLNPLLQNYWMVIHPPSLYTGFVAATIPFAFGIGALASGRLDDLWLGSVRSWMLICFGFLSLGLILGGRWAYEELGWGGYWAWDPVENAGLIPWFTATAFLHSAIIQEQRGMMKRWNLGLVCLTFFFTIFGTFMTRSGIVQSVHAFGEDNVLALQFVVFMACIVVVSVGLITYRWNKLGSKNEFESFMSREFGFLVNNWILLACAFFVLFATMFPTISESLDGSRVSVGKEFFNRYMVVFGLVLLFLAGAVPLLAWRRTTRERLLEQFVAPAAVAAIAIVACLVLAPQSKVLTDVFSTSLHAPVSLIAFGMCAFAAGSIGQEFIRATRVRARQTGSSIGFSFVSLLIFKRRKYGGYIVHLGVAVAFVGFAGKAYERMVDRTIQVPAVVSKQFSWNNDGTVKALPPQTDSAFAFGDYRFLYERLIHTSDDQKDMVTAQVSIWKDGKSLGTVYPAKWDYRRGEEATTEVAIHVRWDEDVYVVLTGYDLDNNLANFRVFINPLISWVWIAFFIIGAGTLICLIPQGLVDMLNSGPSNRSRMGRAGEIGIVLLLAVSVTAGVSTKAFAQETGPAGNGGGAEHVPSGGGMGEDGVGWAAMNRPDSGTAEKAMKELLCVCGCPRESIFDCKCQTAAKLRGEVIEQINSVDSKTGKKRFDLATDEGRQNAYNFVLAGFVKEYGGEQVLNTPRSSFSWLFPTLAAIGGLTTLFVVGRGWIARSKDARVANTKVAMAAVEDEKYADKLDDELAGSDD